MTSGRELRARARFWRPNRIWCLIFLLGLSASAAGQTWNRGALPLPEDRGTAGTLAALQRLPVHARVLVILAHPDDEPAGTMVWLSRKAHATTAIYSLTRGDGGQNVLGDEKYEAMGLLRTGEFLEACRIYGVELYFGTCFDFGFSKNAHETLSKWNREETIEELVRFIRSWRPMVVVSRFQGGSGDGHGHHQAAGLIAREALAAAADPSRFPLHIQQGLPPWQAEKFYCSALGGVSAGGAGDRTLRIPIGDYDPVLGRSYREIGAQGYGNHRSQGNAAAFSLPGAAYDFFRLEEPAAGAKAQDAGFLDAVDTSLPAIVELAGSEQKVLTPLRDGLAAAQQSAESALAGFDLFHPEQSAPEVARGAAILADSLQRLEASPVSKGAKQLVGSALREKLRDFQDALTRSLGIYGIARTESPVGIPGQKVTVTASVYNRGPESVELRQVEVRLPDGGWIPAPAAQAAVTLGGGKTAVIKMDAGIPPESPVTEPFFYRDDRNSARYRTTPTPDTFAPFGNAALSFRAVYRYGEVDAVVEDAVTAQVADPLRGMTFPEFQIVPALSVSVIPDLFMVPASQGPQTRELLVAAMNNNPSGSRGVLTLKAPAGWSVSPASVPFALSRAGESATGKFTVRIPAKPPRGHYVLEGVAATGGKEYHRGYRVVTDRRNWVRHLYAPAQARVQILDVKVAPGLRVGYVMGSGDDVPAALEQLGVSVRMLTREDLAFGDLGGYSAIVTGIRAYNVNEGLQSYSQRLLDYVRDGGTLIVQYNTPLGRGGAAAFPYGPYPMSNSASDRVTDEYAPVSILEPKHRVFATPNKIDTADFEGWVQERGLYFMNQWDPHYTALLACNDPGEQPMRGGMLITQVGRGYYVYTAYAWFRQLPAGVPGAYRLFANLLSLAAPKR